MPIRLPSTVQLTAREGVTPAERGVTHSVTAHAWKALAALTVQPTDPTAADTVAAYSVPVDEDATLAPSLRTLLTDTIVTGLTLIVRADYPTITEEEARDAAVALVADGLGRKATTLQAVTNPREASEDEDTAAAPAPLTAVA